MDADENNMLLSELPSPQQQQQQQRRRRLSSHSHSQPHRHHHRHKKGTTAWYNAQSPPFALWVCGRDNLVDGDKILRRFERGREPHARLVHRKVIPEYEHLDVIWAMDAEDEVFREVREVLWRTASAEDRARCRVPKGCEDVERWVDDRQERRGKNDEEEEEEERGTVDRPQEEGLYADESSEEDEDDDDDDAKSDQGLLSSGLSRSSSSDDLSVASSS